MLPMLLLVNLTNMEDNAKPIDDIDNWHAHEEFTKIDEEEDV